MPTAIPFMNLVIASKPVVFKGAVKDWPAVEVRAGVVVTVVSMRTFR